MREENVNTDVKQERAIIVSNDENFFIVDRSLCASKVSKQNMSQNAIG